MALHCGKKLWKLCDAWYEQWLLVLLHKKPFADTSSRNETLYLLLPGSLCHSIVQDAIVVLGKQGHYMQSRSAFVVGQ